MYKWFESWWEAWVHALANATREDTHWRVYKQDSRTETPYYRRGKWAAYREEAWAE